MYISYEGSGSGGEGFFLLGFKYLLEVARRNVQYVLVFSWGAHILYTKDAITVLF